VKHIPSIPYVSTSPLFESLSFKVVRIAASDVSVKPQSNHKNVSGEAPFNRYRERTGMMNDHDLSDLDDRIEHRDIEHSILRGAACITDDWDVASVQAENLLGVNALVHARHFIFLSAL
jgi:hypothetical protein